MVFRSDSIGAICDSLPIPSCNVFVVRNTAASFCIVRCICLRIAAVVLVPLALRMRSRRESARSEASFARGFCFSPFLRISRQRNAAARPNTTRSSSELAPKRLAPCTDTQAFSPIAIRPGTVASGLALVGLITSPM